MADRIAALRAKLNAAIDDAERDGIRLTAGLWQGCIVNECIPSGETCGCIIGACIGDRQYDPDIDSLELRASVIREFAHRYDVTEPEAWAIEAGFENRRRDFRPTALRPFYELGAEFRQRARRA